MSRSDLLSEQAELATLKDTEIYIKDEQSNPESESNREIDRLDDDVEASQTELTPLQQKLGEGNKEYDNLWVQAKQAADKVTRALNKFNALRTQRDNFRVSSLLQETRVRTAPSTASLPKNFGRLNRKQQNRLLQQLRQSNQQHQNTVNTFLAENQRRIQQLTTELTNARTEYNVARTHQEQVIAQLHRVIDARQPLQNQINAIRTHIHQLQNRISRIERNLQKQLENIQDKIEDLTDQIRRKVITKLQRVELVFYKILKSTNVTEEEEKTLPWDTSKPPGKKKYPKGKLQCIVECDVFFEPVTHTILDGEDPLKTMVSFIQEACTSIIQDKFQGVYIPPNEFTYNIGETNLILDQGSLGVPPIITSVARKIEFNNKRDWFKDVNEAIMSQSAYDAHIERMPDYKAELIRLGIIDEDLHRLAGLRRSE